MKLYYLALTSLLILQYINKKIGTSLSYEPSWGLEPQTYSLRMSCSTN